MKPYALNLEKPEDENSSGKPALIETATFPAVGKPPEIRREEIIHITEAEAAEAAESSAPGKKKRAKRAVDPEKAKKREKLSRGWS